MHCRCCKTPEQWLTHTIPTGRESRRAASMWTATRDSALQAVAMPTSVREAAELGEGACRDNVVLCGQGESE
jgi:hypothetical protein